MGISSLYSYYSDETALVIGDYFSTPCIFNFSFLTTGQILVMGNLPETR